MSNQSPCLVIGQANSTNISHLPPATLEEELAWITQYDGSGQPFEEYICAARHKAVYGTWPDEKPHPLPALDGLHDWQIKWLVGQANPSKWEQARQQAHNGVKVTRDVIPEPEAFPGQREWLKQYNERARKVKAGKRSRSGKPARTRNPIPSLMEVRAELREWFLTNISTATHDEWASKFLELREIEQRISVAQANRDLRRTQTAKDSHRDDRISVTPLGHAVLARRMRGAA